MSTYFEDKIAKAKILQQKAKDEGNAKELARLTTDVENYEEMTKNHEAVLAGDNLDTEEVA
jgi:uncharacterized protein YihD (DUF1040 family)